MKKLNRRSFLQKSATASLGLVTLGSLPIGCADERVKKITILHTNDVHSHIDPFPINHPRYPNQGGIARRATLIAKLRAENPNTLLFDAGDIFQGTPYFNFYEGALEFKLMSMLKYDASTLGNHDFDNGLKGFNKQLHLANFDFLSANYDFKNTILDGKTKPYKIYDVDGIKIGVFGLGIELKGLVDPKNYKETKYLNPIEITQDMTCILKQDKKCDMVICLSHLGYKYKREPQLISDIKLATQTKDIDLIIGGHTHTFLPEPTVIKNKENKIVLVNQVGAYGLELGKIDFYFTQNKLIKTKSKPLKIS